VIIQSNPNITKVTLVKVGLHVDKSPGCNNVLTNHKFLTHRKPAIRAESQITKLSAGTILLFQVQPYSSSFERRCTTSFPEQRL